MNESIPGKAEEIKRWETGLHLIQLLNLVIPAGGLIGAAAIWALKGSESEKILREGKDVLNFQITVLIFCTFLSLPRFYTLLSGVGDYGISAVVSFSAAILSTVGMLALGIQVLFPVLAVTKTQEGKEPYYPVLHRFFN